MRDKKLDLLFEPLEIPNLKLKNRFFMAPMGTTFTVAQTTDYLVARAKGEVALITTPEFSIHPSGRAGMVNELFFETDDDIKTWTPLVKAVQNADAKIVAQLNHAGRYSYSKLIGKQSVAPSPIASRYTGETPRKLTTQEVDDLVIAFGEAALRARKAGFDGIELLGSSGYLISQFLSPLTNKREDKYGGDVLQRAGFLFSVLKEIRERVGSDFNVCVKYDAEDGMEGGKTLEDSLILAPEIVKAGADRLHIWAGWHEATRPMLPMSVPRGAFAYLAKAIKDVVDVPVSTVGRINDPYVAADILAKGKADLIGLGRTLLCDPEFVKKTMDGRTKEIRKCTACCYCFDQVMRAIKGDQTAELKCSINAELGREGEGLLKPASGKRRVVVVGGGPAGMEVARVAAVRGHKVVLFEENDKLGGMVNVAYLPPHKEELKNLVDYYVCQMDILNVDVNLGKSLNLEKLKAIRPDVVIFATGAEPLIPKMPGIDGKQVVTAIEILKGTKAAGETIVVIGGGLIGVETAEFLAEKGKDVTIVEMLKSVAVDIGPTMRWGVVSRVKKKTHILTLTRAIEVKQGCVVVEGQDKSVKEISADTVVVASGLKCRTSLAESVGKSGIECHVIGSCRRPGQIADAVEDAFAIGCKV